MLWVKGQIFHCAHTASYPEASLSMKTCAQRKAGRREHGPMRFVTSHLHKAVASAVRKTMRLRRIRGKCARAFESSRLTFCFRLLELTIPILRYSMVRTIINLYSLRFLSWQWLYGASSSAKVFTFILDTIFVEMQIKEWDKAVKKF